MYACAIAFSDSEVNINKYLVLLERTAPVPPTSGINKNRKDIHMVSDSIW